MLLEGLCVSLKWLYSLLSLANTCAIINVFTHWNFAFFSVIVAGLLAKIHSVTGMEMCHFSHFVIIFKCKKSPCVSGSGWCSVSCFRSIIVDKIHTFTHWSFASFSVNVAGF